MRITTSQVDPTTLGAGRACRWNGPSVAPIIAGAAAVTLVIAALVHRVPVTPALTVAMLAPAAVIDVRVRRLPDVWVAAALATFVVVGMVSWAVGNPPPSMAMLGGALLAAGPILAMHLVSPASMGFGDVKAAAVIGLAVGSVDWRLALVALTLAAGSAAVHGLATRARTVAFGPFLVLGAIVALLFANMWIAPMVDVAVRS